MDKRFPLRTEHQGKTLLERYRQLTTAASKAALCNEHSFHPVECGLWGFAEGDTVVGSCNWAFAFEAMHVEDLGVFINIIDSIKVCYVATLCDHEALSPSVPSESAPSPRVWNPINSHLPFAQPYLDTHYQSSECKDRVIAINTRMQLFPRSEDFALPLCNGVYIPDHSRVQAKEHRNVMQVLPHMLHGVDDDLTELACL